VVDLEMDENMRWTHTSTASYYHGVASLHIWAADYTHFTCNGVLAATAVLYLLYLGCNSKHHFNGLRSLSPFICMQHWQTNVNKTNIHYINQSLLVLKVNNCNTWIMTRKNIVYI
jgi:hypothetical protein